MQLALNPETFKEDIEFTPYEKIKYDNKCLYRFLRGFRNFITSSDAEIIDVYIDDKPADHDRCDTEWLCHLYDIMLDEDYDIPKYHSKFDDDSLVIVIRDTDITIKTNRPIELDFAIKKVIDSFTETICVDLDDLTSQFIEKVHEAD